MTSAHASLWAACAAGLLGIPVGSVLHIVVRRAHHEGCGSSRWRAAVRSPLLAVATALAFALVAWWAIGTLGWPVGSALEVIAWWLTLSAFLWFAASSIVLALIDVAYRRLPDAVVLPSVGVVAVALASASLLTEDWGRFLSTLAGSLVAFGTYFVIALAYPRGLGGGDVKLALLVGAVLGYLGWAEVVVGIFLGFALGALWALPLIVRGAAMRKAEVPFGPFMLLGAWTGAVGGRDIATACLTVAGLV